MKKQKSPKPAKHHAPTFNQLCKLIIVGMVRDLAQQYKVKVDKKSRMFLLWSHVVPLLFAQLIHCIGLNDMCDALRHHAARLFAIRANTVPSRNGLSNANKTSNADMMNFALEGARLSAKSISRLWPIRSLQRTPAPL